MDDQAPAKKVFENDPSGVSRWKGRPRMRWGAQVEENLKLLTSLIVARSQAVGTTGVIY